jgi:hypothetical protein
MMPAKILVWFFQQESAEGDGEDQAEIFGAIPHQHA